MSVQLKRTLSFTDVFAIALGQVIGSGIMVLIGIGIEFTAYAIPLAFVLSAALSVIKQLPVAFLGSAMPATGGLYVYCKRVLGPRVAFFYLAILLITHILIALFALGFAQYALALIPGLNERAVAVGVLVLFYLVNLTGVRMAASLQKVMIVFLLVGLSSLVAFGWGDVDFSQFSGREALLPNGWYGFGLACVVLSFSTGGAQYVSELGGEMTKPERDLPRAIIFSTLLAAVFFALVSIVAVGRTAGRADGGKDAVGSGSGHPAAKSVRRVHRRCRIVRAGHQHQLHVLLGDEIGADCLRGRLAAETHRRRQSALRYAAHPADPASAAGGGARRRRLGSCVTSSCSAAGSFLFTT